MASRSISKNTAQAGATKAQDGIRKIARERGVGIGTVQRIKAALAA